MNVDAIINLLADKTCNNCRHFVFDWCRQDHNESSILEGTCEHWIKKDLDIWNFSIPKNPCGEIPLNDESICSIKAYFNIKEKI